MSTTPGRPARPLVVGAALTAAVMVAATLAASPTASGAAADAVPRSAPPAARAPAAPGHAVVPSPTPAAGTPAVNDGQTNAITQVGSTVVVGGTFTSVTPPGGGPTPRSGVMAFDATTGALRPFNPVLNGAVEDVLPGPRAGTVYVAGRFTTVNGTNASHVVLLDATSGALVPGFRAAGTNGIVSSLATARGRLVLGGNFTTAGGAAHGGLAALDPSTGAVDPWMGVDVANRHNDTGSGAQGPVGVRELDTTSDGSTLVAVGNFKTVDGLDRDQAVLLDLTTTSSAVDPGWQTNRYKPYCFSFAFDSYVRGVAVSPDDSYFVITSTGGQNAGTLCDTAARFEISATGSDVQPTWVDYTGGDTLWSVEVTETAVYVGGHQRWMNNSDASDTNGQGSVPRPGLAALDPGSGLPLSWNPGRNPRGAAAFALYASPTGLWVGSDTEWIGDFRYRRPRLAFFPLAGGSAPASERTPTLPGQVYLGSPRTASTGNVLYRVNAGGGSLSAVDAGPDWESDSPYVSGSTATAGWGPGSAVDATVPASTPRSLFDTERWSPSDSPRMSYDFPVPAGVPLQVRLYFANRCGCTSTPGSRVFDVDLDGQRVLDDLDVVAAVGDQRGTMRAFDVTSDGRVDLDFAHVRENPLVNGIEIVRRDLPPPPTSSSDALTTVPFDGASAGVPVSVPGAAGVDWGSVRGAFLAGDTLYYARSDGYLHRRSFTGASTGPDSTVDPYDDPAWNDVTTGSGGTFRGRVPTFYGEIGSLTGMFYADDRLYYTLAGSDQLFWRWFSADSGITGSQRFSAATGPTWSDAAGLFRSGGSLYVVSRSSGALSAVSFAGGAPSGAPTLVDDSIDWRARAVLLGPDVPNQAPAPSFGSACTDGSCDFDGSASADPDGHVASWAWTFGDGGTADGPTPTHAYTASGSYPVTLTVTDDDGATASTTRTVTVTVPAPPSSVSHVAVRSSTANSAAPTVTVPAATQPGDRLVLVGSYGADTTVATPAGWTLAAQRTNGAMAGYVWTRSATAADAGSTVTTPAGVTAKSALTLSVYRGVSATTPLPTVVSSADSGGTSHVSPTTSAPSGSWTVQVWSDKSSATTAWTAPPGVSVRDAVYGTGTGRMTMLTVDSGGATAGGQVGGATARTDAASGRAVAWTIVLAPSP